ncbi:MAG: 5-formyltetrahydrofolate cyclo-ligase [Ruminococcus sp.]|nr:5-formyltetrahydrofolate cyclo-ligase [Ruminococcus sp.]
MQNQYVLNDSEAESVIEEKKHLRKKFKNIRNTTPKIEKHYMDKYLENLFISSDEYKNCDIILTYVSYGSEADTINIIKTALEQGKIVGVPKCLPDNKMQFYKIHDLSELEKGAYGIPEPPDSCEIINLNEERNKNIVCLVPGLSFDEHGNRLGYGGGYYDRFIQEHPDIITIGICSSHCFSEHIPTEPTDMKVKIVIKG